MSKIICSAPICNVKEVLLGVEQSHQIIQGLPAPTVRTTGDSLYLYDKDADLSELESYLRANSHSTLVVLYDGLANVMFDAIRRQECSATEAAELWCDFVRQIVRLYKHFRERIQVFDVNHIYANTLAFNAMSGINITNNLKGCETPSVFKIVVELLARKNVTVKQCLSSIEAVTTPLSAGEISECLDIDAALLEWHKSSLVVELQKDELIKQQQDLKVDYQTLTEENQLLLEQLHTVQKAIEEELLSKDELIKQQQDLKADYQTLTEENQLLLEQLHTVQEALDEELLSNAKNEIKKVSNSTELKPLEESTHKTAKKLSLIQKIKKNLVDSKHASLIERSPFFDASWYLEQYPDIAKIPKFKKNPALHYIIYGGFEGRNPSVRFNSKAYLNSYPDVQETAINPLVHYILHGKSEGRDPTP